MYLTFIPPPKVGEELNNIKGLIGLKEKDERMNEFIKYFQTQFIGDDGYCVAVVYPNHFWAALKGLRKQNKDQLIY